MPNFGGRYAVGDVSLVLLREIVHGIPVMDLLNLEQDPECGQCAWWEFARSSPDHRKIIMSRVREWLASQQLEWRPSASFESMECIKHCEHPAGGSFFPRADVP